MSKICPDCQEVFDDNRSFCDCGARLVDMAEKPNPTLNLGDANAVSGGIHIDQTKNITTHDVHYHTVQAQKSEKELLQEHQNQYHDVVAKLLTNGVITVEARARLDKLKSNLGLDSSTAARIEAEVRHEQKTQAQAVNEGLSVIGKMVLKSAISAVENNSPVASGCIPRLAPVCKTTMNEQAHYYYNMLMAAFEPQQCVEVYEKRTADSYWQAFWTSIALRKLGKEFEAESVLNEMSVLWPDRPEINVIVNACVGLLCSNMGKRGTYSDMVVELLAQSNESPSEILSDLYHALLYQVNIEKETNDRYAFYEEQFFSNATGVGQSKYSKEYADEMWLANDAYERGEYEKAMDIWKKWAENDDTEAMLRLANAYNIGKGVFGVDNRSQERLKWYRKAADLGNTDAMKELGDDFRFCNFSYPNHTQEAIKWYRKAAESGNVEAMDCLRYHYFYGDGVEPDCEAAIKWSCKAADLGYSKALIDLGDDYLEEKKDSKEALKWYHKAVDLGNTEAMIKLGDLYMEGKDVGQDSDEAMKWYCKAADAGNIDAMNKLGSIYLEGHGVEKDGQKAVGWYSKAAELGDEDAMWSLGDMYFEGNGVEQDYSKAAYWYFPATDNNKKQREGAMIRLAETYFNMHKYNDAVFYYQAVAESGGALSDLAMIELGEMYFYGKGVKQDYDNAEKWFKLAAESENEYAMADLAKLYTVLGKSEEAAKWGRMALNNGFKKENKDVPMKGSFNSISEVEDSEAKLQKAKEAFDNEDYETARDIYMELSENNTTAMVGLGDCYSQLSCFDESRKWWQEAANHGDAVGMARLAHMNYTIGKVNEAQQWEEKALRNGYVDDEEDVLFGLEFIKDLTSDFLRDEEISTSAVFEKAWVNQVRDDCVIVHFSLQVHAPKGKTLKMKFVTKSLTRNSTHNGSGVIFSREEKHEMQQNTKKWDDLDFLIPESEVGRLKAGSPFELQSELSVYDENDNCIGSGGIKYSVNHVSRLLFGKLIVLNTSDFYVN